MKREIIKENAGFDGRRQTMKRKVWSETVEFCIPLKSGITSWIDTKPNTMTTHSTPEDKINIEQKVKTCI